MYWDANEILKSDAFSVTDVCSGPTLVEKKTPQNVVDLFRKHVQFTVRLHFE